MRISRLGLPNSRFLTKPTFRTAIRHPGRLRLVFNGPGHASASTHRGTLAAGDCARHGGCAAKSWFNRMRLVMQLGQGVLSDTWLEGGTVNGYTIHPLIEQSELLAEAHQMQNCADQYSERLSRERCRRFSIRRGGTRVATMEIGPHPRETGVLAIVQLKARHNMPAPTEVWQAAYGWLAAQARLKRLAPESRPTGHLQRKSGPSCCSPIARLSAAQTGCRQRHCNQPSQHSTTISAN